MYLAFYKYNGDLSDKLIRWWTKGSYSHTELVTDDFKYMYSSSGLDNGVRKKEHYYDTKKWDYIKVDVSLDLVIKVFNLTKDSKYDWLGILGFVLPFQDRANKWFCSEWCANILKCSGNKKFYLVEPSKTSPNDLYKIVKEN